jgi:hypothetical protein
MSPQAAPRRVAFPDSGKVVTGLDWHAHPGESAPVGVSHRSALSR